MTAASALAAAKAAEDTTGSDVHKKSQAAAWAFFWRTPAIMWVYLFGLVLALAYACASFSIDATNAAIRAAQARARGAAEAGWTPQEGAAP